jgi:adenylylsulfate kinase-like enzyme
MKKKKFIKNKGILFWITGLSGSGKTTLANKISNHVNKKYGPTLLISGDELRNIFNFDKFDKKSRLKYALSYSKLCKLMTDNKINVLFSTVSLFHQVRKWNHRNIKNYLEIYIESNINELIKQKKKIFYKIKPKNIVGKNIIAELPRSADIIIKNNFDKTINELKEDLINKISKKTSLSQ